jgi:quercetin dioxygenase-like cupin family protein
MGSVVGQSADKSVSGVSGENTAGGIGVFGSSDSFEGVHGESHSGNTAAVAGTNNTAPGSIGTFGQSDPGRGVVGVSKTNAGVFGVSDSFEGVHGESHSGTAAAVAGNNTNTGPGVFGKSSGGAAGFFDGDVVVTRNLTAKGDIFLTNGDCAEDFDVSGTTDIEPGTVMVLDKVGAVEPSQCAYDKRVAGVVSGAGDFKPGIVLDKHQSRTNRMAIALLGKVYCKVDAQYSPVQVGDLLTTSPTAGHAMKAVDPSHAFGAVIGKALRPLAEGRGLIPILIALQ